MKTKIAWGVAGLVLLATVLVSCGNMLAHTGQGGSSGAGNFSSGEGSRAGSKTLSLVVANYGEHFGNGATNSIVGGPLRTIVGDAYDSTEVKFYLWGESSTGTPLEPKEVTVTPDPLAGTNMTGSLSVNLDPGAWDLTLAAVPNAKTGALTQPLDKSNIVDNAALKGEAHVDTMNASVVRFTLRSDGLTGVAPTVRVAVTAKNNWFDDAKWDAYAGIYDLLTGVLVKTEKDISTGLNAGGTGEYSETDIPPGKYAFKVVFTKDGEKDNIVATWSDTIIIYAAKELDESVEIPELVDKAPDAPTGLKAGWDQNNADRLAVNFYEATFQWTRGASKNEAGFELELMDIGDSDLAAQTPVGMETLWGQLAATNSIATYDSNIYGQMDKWTDGSLAAANEEVKLLLPMGSRYIARIRAINNGGESAYVYADLAQQITTFERFNNVINVYKVRYELDGGDWQNGPNAVGGDTKANVTEFFAEKANRNQQDITIRKPDGAGADGTLSKNGQNWAGWQKGDGTLYLLDAAGTALEKYNNPVSLTLTAKYGSAGGSYEWEIFNDADYDIKTGWVAVEATATPGGGGGAMTVTPVLDFDAGTVGVERTKGGSNYVVTFKLTVQGGTTWNYDVVGLEINRGSSVYNNQQKAATVGTSTDFAVDVSSWPTGNYQCTLIAYMGRTIVSKPITLTIADN